MRSLIRHLVQKGRMAFADSGFARRHGSRIWMACYGGCVFYVFLSASLNRFRLPQEPWSDLDVAGYLLPALSKLNGGAFTHVNGISSLYPADLYLILRAVSDFRAIAVAQHLLGLLTGALFLVSWNRLFDLVPRLFLRRAVHQSIGLLGAATYLLANRPVVLEFQIRADAICMFFQMLTLGLTLEYFYQRQVAGRAQRALFCACASIFSASLLASLKPSFFLFALLIFLIVGWLVFSRGDGRTSLIFGLTTAAVVLAVFLPEYRLRRSDHVAGRFLTQTLFAVHAKLIHVQIEKDLWRGESGPYPAAWLREADRQLVSAMAQTHAMYPAQFRSLGFDPDYLMNGSDVLFAWWKKKLGGEKPLLQFLSYYYWRTVAQEPAAIAAKVMRQMLIFYADRCPAFSSKRTIRLAPRDYVESLAALAQTHLISPLASVPGGPAFLARTAQLTSRDVRVRENRRIVTLNQQLSRAYRPLVLAGVLVAICWVVFRRGGRQWAPWMAIFLCLPNFANTFSISLIHTMDVDRYSYVQFAAAIFAELWILSWLLDLCLGGLARVASIARQPSRAVTQASADDSHWIAEFH